MEKTQRKPRNKPYFCYDENLQFIELKKKCSKFVQFESFVKLMKKQGAKDEQVIAACNKNDKHIITHNTKDFRNPKGNVKIGIICIGLRSEDDWIPKLIKLFRLQTRHDNYYYKTIFIDNTIKIKDRKSGDVRIIS